MRLQQNKRFWQTLSAAGEGIEPSLSPPKGDVLPLDDPAFYAGVQPDIWCSLLCYNTLNAKHQIAETGC